METATICPYCGVGCNLIVISDGKNIQNIVPSNRKDLNFGALCIKGWKGINYVNSTKRLKKPLLKVDNKFVEISWDQAISITVNKLSETMERYGPNSIAFQASAKCTNEDNYLMQKLARQVFHTNNVDHCARSCHASTIEGLISTIGSGAMTTSIADIDNADLYFVIGSNTTEQHPIIGARIINNVRVGKKLILADPRKIQLSNFAEIHLRHYPGTDLALLNTMAHVIIEKDLHNKKFIEERTENFEEFRKIIEFYDLERGSRITGVDAKAIEEAAILYGTSKSIIFYAMGITQHTQGTQNVQAVANLALLTGNVGIKGTGIAPLRGQNNVQGSSDMGALCDLLPGYKKVYDDQAREKFEKYWICKLPKEPGLSLTEMFEEVLKNKVKVMYIMGENPVISEPDNQNIIKALKNLDFLIVQDIFLTETAQLSDLVLPTYSFAEKLGTFTNTERRIQLINPFLEPIGEAKNDWVIFQTIANKMGYKWSYLNAEDIMNEISQLVSQYSSVSYSCIKEKGIQWPVKDCVGTEIMHTEKFTRGKGKFIPNHWKKPSEYADEQYPFILTTGRIYYQFHTGTMTRKVNTLEREAPEPYVEMSPNDAKKYNIKNEEYVILTSRYGSLTVKVKVTDMVMDGILFMSFHYYEAPANKITNPTLDPISKIPELKVTAVKLEKIG